MKKAVLVMTYGSPEEYTFEGVAKFFTNIRRGIRPTDEEIETLLNNYLLIKGSPLQEITKKEVELLAERVREEYAVYFANKFSTPYIPSVINEMEEDGVSECICLILEPHYSFYSIMGYEKFIKSSRIKFNIIKSWYKEESLIDFWVDEIRNILEQDVKEESYKVIFSAHSVPEIALRYNDPYVEQIFDMTEIIARRLGLSKDNYTNTWQSESDIGMPWIKPDVLEYIKEQKNHPENYIFVPLSFISEHIEVLFDNDVECKELCEEFGVKYHRPPMPNSDERLITALASAIEKNKNSEFSYHNPEQSTFDELAKEGEGMPEHVRAMLKGKGEETQMPDFVREMLKGKGEKTQMPEHVQAMLKGKGEKAQMPEHVRAMLKGKGEETQMPDFVREMLKEKKGK